MKGNSFYVDYEKRELEAAEEGFSSSKFANMIIVLTETHGDKFASYWSTLTKAQKKEFCARIIINWSYDEKLKNKAKKYITKRFRKDTNNNDKK